MAPTCDRREGGLSHYNSSRMDACGLSLRLSNWKNSGLGYIEWSEEVYGIILAVGVKYWNKQVG